MQVCPSPVRLIHGGELSFDERIRLDFGVEIQHLPGRSMVADRTPDPARKANLAGPSRHVVEANFVLGVPARFLVLRLEDSK